MMRRVLVAGGLFVGLLCAASNPNIDRIRQLGRTDSQAIPTIAQYLSDSDPATRLAAVKAITQIGTGASIEPLVRATHDADPDVQIAATDGIVNFYLPGYVPKNNLTGTFTKSVRKVRAGFPSRNDQTIASDIQIRPDAAQAIGAEVTTGTALDVRANAARAAGILRDRAALPQLEQALRSKDSDLIFESLVALQKIGDPSAGPSVSFLARDLDNRIQITALETIGDLKSLNSAPDVRMALNGARNIKVRRAALGALAMMGIPGDRQTFVNYASDKDDALRADALEGLGRIREPEDTPVLQSAYDEQNADWRVHLAAAFGLVDEGKVGTEEFSPLRFLVENLDLRNRSSVAQAYLTELARREDVRRALYPIVNDSTTDQKVALCDILASTHAPDAEPTLTAFSRDTNPDVALAGAKALRVLQARPMSSNP